MARWLTLVLGAGAFLAAAKAHGRQLRLEREAAGYLQVRFGGENAEWVEAFWRRERLYFWGIVAALVLVSLVIRAAATRLHWAIPQPGGGAARWLHGALLLHGLFPALGAFVARGLASALRTGLGSWESAGWWGLVLGLTAALCVVAWRV